MLTASFKLISAQKLSNAIYHDVRADKSDTDVIYVLCHCVYILSL